MSAWPGDEDGDRGLPVERTVLAWERTALGFLGVALAVLFPRLLSVDVTRTTVALAAVAVAAGVFALGRMRRRAPTARFSAALPVVGFATGLLAVAIAVAVARE